MSTMQDEQLPFPLGRKLEPNHDPRSWNHPALAVEGTAMVTTLHQMYGKVLDQLQVGSCTGNATTHMRNSKPFHVPPSHDYTETDAVKVYTRATEIDPYPDTYPAEDTGSDGMSAVKAATEFGWFAGYTHAFGLDHALAAFVLSPGIIGIRWHQDMFYPDARGFLSPTGPVVGGHEIAVTQVHFDASYPGGGYIKGPNSWGKTWGLKGYYCMSFTTLDLLLTDNGDVTFGVKK